MRAFIAHTLLLNDHSRFFPQSERDGDRSGNCRAGTVVDREVAHPTEFDFYLQSHGGLLGMGFRRCLGGGDAYKTSRHEPSRALFCPLRREFLPFLWESVAI